MYLSTDYLNPNSITSITMLSEAAPLLAKTVLKQVKISASFANQQKLQLKTDYSMEFHPLTGKEYQKLITCYKCAMQIAGKNVACTALNKLKVKIVYIDYLEQETRVTLTPSGLILDLTDLNP